MLLIKRTIIHNITTYIFKASGQCCPIIQKGSRYINTVTVQVFLVCCVTFGFERKIHTNFCKSRTHFLAFTVPGIQLIKLSALDYSFVSSDKLRLQIRTILLSTRCKTSRLLICDLILLLDRLFLGKIFN